MVAKADGDEVVGKEESGANGKAATTGFERSVVRATGNMAKSCYQFGRTEEQRVLQEQMRPGAA